MLLCTTVASGVIRGHLIIPFGQNEGFVGRDSILQQLSERIPPCARKNDCQWTAIVGLGGVGKTQIALEAAYRLHAQDLTCSIFWAPAVNMTMCEKAYLEIGQRLGVSGIEDDKADVKVLVQNALSQNTASSWLLIVDNIDDLGLLSSADGHSLRDYLPQSRKGSILFTTRNQEVVTKLDIPARDVLRVTEMSQAEAVKLLGNNLREDQMRNTESTKKLADFLACLPLAIKQASMYMSRTGISTAKYLEHCLSSDKTQVKLLSEHFEDRNRYRETANPIATTWLISFDHIAQKHPLAAHYLKFISFLAEKDIPASILPRGEDELEEDEAVGVLAGYAFIRKREGADSYDIHRLVRLATRSWVANANEWGARIRDVMDRLRTVYPDPGHENRDVWMGYMPHVILVLRAYEEPMKEKPDLALLFRVAKSFHETAKYKEAEQILRQVIELRMKVLGPKHPITLSSRNNLALVLHSQGKHEEAEQIHRQTLELTIEVLGPKHPETLAIMTNLANTLNSQGKHEAEQMHQQTVELTLEVLGPKHLDTLISMENLALMLVSQLKHEEAEQIYRQTLELSMEVLGPKHPDTLISMNNLALTLNSQGKHKEAEQMHRQTLELTIEVLGPKHLDTLISMNSLGLILYSQGKHKEAEQIYRQELELSMEVLGPKHLDTLVSRKNLALILHSQGKHKEAEEILRQVIELRMKVLGPKHPITLSSMNNLAEVLRSQGKHKEEADRVRSASQSIEISASVEHY